MAAVDHVSSPPPMQQPPISSPMTPANEFLPQGRGSRLTPPPEEPLRKPGEDGEGGEGAGQQQQQEGGQQGEEWQASQQQQVEGEKKVEVFNPEECWRVEGGNMISEVQAAVKAGQQGWQQLCAKEQLCLSRLQELCKAAHTTNASFHNQHDTLHSTVLTMVSSFKK